MKEKVITFHVVEDGECAVLVNGVVAKMIFDVENIVELLNTKSFAANEVGICPNCGSDSQVWKNQLTGRLTCHRVGCDNLEL